MRFICLVLSLIALAAMGCGDPLTTAQMTQTAQPTDDATAAAQTPDIGTAVSPLDTPTPEPLTTPTAEPATPEPEPTLPDEPTNVPDRVGHLPTATSDSEPMALGGVAYVDARPVVGTIRAFIGDRECGNGQSVALMGNVIQFVVLVTSDAGQAGCGVPGAIVNFTINGQAANEKVTWKPGFQEEQVALSVGPVFAMYRGSFSRAPGFDAPMLVVPYIDGVACGTAVTPEVNLLNHARWEYRALVDPAQLRAGCGRDGASVVLRPQVEGGPSIELATVPWQTLPVVNLPNVDLRRVLPAASPSTGVAQ